MKRILLCLAVMTIGLNVAMGQNVDMSKVMSVWVGEDSLYVDLLLESYGEEAVYAKVVCGEEAMVVNMKDGASVKCDLHNRELKIYGAVEGMRFDLEGGDYDTKCGLDVSGNNGLQFLNCSYSNVETLILGEQPLLTYLDCQDNVHLSKLDVSGCPELTMLECSINKLRRLDVSKNVKLERLLCAANDLKLLDVSRLTELTELDCLGNELRKLDVSNCTKLEFLICEDNKLRELDVSNNMELVYFFCEENRLRKLDVSGHHKLHKLRCFDNQLEELKVSDCPNLWELLCMRNKLRELDVSRLTNLWHFGYEDNMIEDVDWVNEEDALKMEYVR